MEKYQLMGRLAQVQLDLLKVVTDLSDIEREIQRGGEKERRFTISDSNMELLKDGFTVTLIGGGTAVQVQLENETKTMI